MHSIWFHIYFDALFDIYFQSQFDIYFNTQCHIFIHRSVSIFNVQCDIFLMHHSISYLMHHSMSYLRHHSICYLMHRSISVFVHSSTSKAVILLNEATRLFTNFIYRPTFSVDNQIKMRQYHSIEKDAKYSLVTSEERSFQKVQKYVFAAPLMMRKRVFFL